MTTHKQKNCIEFNRGNIVLNEGIKLYLTPLNVYLCILKELNEHLKNNSNKIEILRNLIKEDANIIINSINETNKSKIISKGLELFNYFGFGELILKKSNSKEIIIGEEGQYLSRAYNSIFKKNPEIPFEEIISGYLEEIFEIAYKKKNNVGCVIKGTRIFWKISIIDEEIIDKKNINKYEFEETNEYKQSIILKKILQNNQINIEKGKVFLWGVHATFLPILFTSKIFQEIEKNNPKFIENIGIMLGKVCVELQQKVFGKKEKLFEDVVMQTELVGNGIAQYSFEDGFSKVDFNYENGNVGNDEIFNPYKLYIHSIIQGIYEDAFQITADLITESNKVKINKTEENSRVLNKEQENILKVIKTQVIVSKTKN